MKNEVTNPKPTNRKDATMNTATVTFNGSYWVIVFTTPYITRRNVALTLAEADRRVTEFDRLFGRTEATVTLEEGN
jgi:hypothetical protein